MNCRRKVFDLSEKLTDKHNRWRNKTIAFRVTAEEYEKIKAMVEISGMTKQEYIIHCLQSREVVIVGNPRVHKALKKYIDQLYQELTRLHDISELDPEKLELIEYLCHVCDGMKNNHTHQN